MLKQTTDPDMIQLQHTLKQLSHELAAQREHNAIQDKRIEKLENVVIWYQKLHNQLRQQIQDMEESVDFTTSRIRHLTHVVDENEDLRNQLSRWKPPEDD